MRRPWLFLLVVMIFQLPGVGAGQTSPDKTNFRSPVNYPITLSGSFGEIRRNHFHSGIDIRTGGSEGKPVYAIADGYVSRVNISAVGFGKAIYITHPNGYTSLYAHLQRLAGPFAAWVKKQQYEQESFTMDTEVPAGVLKVRKGDLIAYSGNSGSSGGPHIHFEIRDTKTQEIIDPLDFGFLEPDDTHPKITGLKIYPYDAMSMVNFSSKALSVLVTGSGKHFSVKVTDTVRVSGKIYFAIETSDAAEGGLKTGVHKIRLSVDGSVVFSQDIDRFAFAETRYVNSLLDYPAYVQHKRKFQRSYVAPNNKLGIYQEVKDRGIISFSAEGRHRIRYEVTDAFGHTSELVFWVKSHPLPGGGARPVDKEKADGKIFTWRNDNVFSHEGMNLMVPSEAVYEDFSFEFSVTSPAKGSYSRVYHLHNRLTPLHTWCDLKIDAKGIPEKLRSKSIIVSVSAGGKFSSAGGKYENGWITTRIRDFGNYTIAADTENPVIRPVNIANNKKIGKQMTIKLQISDNLAGIATYRGTLNGKWILMDYDAKNRMLTYLIDEHLKPGKNQFVLKVTDAVGNESVYRATVIR